MNRHPYNPDHGGIRHAKRRAVADRTAVDAGGYPGVRKGGCGLWLFAVVPGAVALVGWAGGVLLTWWAG